MNSFEEVKDLDDNLDEDLFSDYDEDKKETNTDNDAELFNEQNQLEKSKAFNAEEELFSNTENNYDNLDEDLFSEAYEESKKIHTPDDDLFDTPKTTTNTDRDLDKDLFSGEKSLSIYDDLMPQLSTNNSIEDDELFNENVYEEYQEVESNIVIKTPKEVLDKNVKALKEFMDVKLSVTTKDFLNKISNTSNDTIDTVTQRMLLKKALENPEVPFDRLVVNFISENEGRYLTDASIMADKELFEIFKECWAVKGTIEPKMKEAAVLKRSSEKLAKMEEIRQQKIFEEILEVNKIVSSDSCVGITQMINNDYICGSCGERNEMSYPLYEINILSRNSSDQIVVLPKYSNCCKCGKTNIMPYSAIEKIKNYVSKDSEEITDSSKEIKKMILPLSTLKDLVNGIVDIIISNENSFLVDTSNEGFDRLNFKQYYKNLRAFRVTGDARELLANYLARNITTSKIIANFMNTELFSNISNAYYLLESLVYKITSASIQLNFLANLETIEIFRDYDEEAELKESFYSLQRLTGLNKLKWYIKKDDVAHWSNVIDEEAKNANIEEIGNYIMETAELFNSKVKEFEDLKAEIPNCYKNITIQSSTVNSYSHIWKVLSVKDVALFDKLRDNYIKANLKSLLKAEMSLQPSLMQYVNGNLSKLKPEYLRLIFSEADVKKFSVSKDREAIFKDLYNNIFFLKNITFGEDELTKLIKLPIEYIKSEIVNKDNTIEVSPSEFDLDKLVANAEFISTNLTKINREGIVNKFLGKHSMEEFESNAIRDLSNEFTEDTVAILKSLEATAIGLDTDKLEKEVDEIYRRENTRV